MQKLPVLKALGATFAFVLHHWQDIVRIVWAPLTLMVVGGPLMALALPQARMSGASPQEALAAMSAAAPLLLVTTALLVYGYLVIYAGLLKLLIRGERPATPFYLGFGGDEARLFGAALIVFFILVGACFASALVAGIVVGISGAASGGNIGIAALAVDAIVLVICGWFGVRLMLALPATVALQRIGVGPGWARAKGTMWPLFFYALFWTILAAIIQVAYISIAIPGYFAYMADIFAGQTPDPSRLTQNLKVGSPMWILDLVLSYVVTFVSITFGATASGVAWRLLTDDEQVSQF